MGDPTPDSRFFEALGRAIKMHRARLGMERKDLADRADVSYPYLSEIENGKKRPSSRALLSLAEALGMKASELLEETESLTASRRRSWFKGDSRLAPQVEATARSVTTAGAPPAAAASFAASRPSTKRSALGSPRETIQRHVEGIMLAEAASKPGLMELLQIADGLPEEDVERLIDLARRLSG